MINTTNPSGDDWRRIVKSINDCMVRQNAIPGALKTPADLERYQKIIEQTNPDLVIETGTLHGVSALWFADTAGCPVWTVDIQPAIHAVTMHKYEGRVRVIYGDSGDPVLAKDLAGMAAEFERVTVVLDSAHDPGHAYKELLGFGPLVSPGCFLVVEDTLTRWMEWWGMGNGPLAAIDDYRRYFPSNFVADEIEDLSDTTQNPGGWLRRTTAPYERADQATCPHEDARGSYWRSGWQGGLGTMCDRCGIDYTTFARKTDPDYQPPLMA
jgi:cephalosporin hydroxylase